MIKKFFPNWSTTFRKPVPPLPIKPLEENSTILSQLQEMNADGKTLGFLSFVARTDQYWNNAQIREAALLLAEQTIINVPVANIKLSFHPKIEAGLIANGGIKRINQAFEESERKDKGAERCFQKRYAPHLNLHKPSELASPVALS